MRVGIRPQLRGKTPLMIDIEREYRRSIEYLMAVRYYTQGHSTTDIANEFGVSQGSVSRWMRWMEMDARSMALARFQHSAPPAWLGDQQTAPLELVTGAV